jgi:hypothetical protein
MNTTRLAYIDKELGKVLKQFIYNKRPALITQKKTLVHSNAIKLAAVSAVVFCLYCAVQGKPTGLRKELSR